MRHLLPALFVLLFFTVNAQKDGATLKPEPDLKFYLAYKNYSFRYDTTAKCTYIHNDSTGHEIRIVLDNPYEPTRCYFRQGLVQVREGDMQGALLRLDGQLLLDRCHFFRFYPQDSIITAWVCCTGWEMIKYDGTKLHKEPIHNRSNVVPEITAEIFAAETDTAAGYMNKQGHWVIQPVYEKAMPFKDGKAKVKVGGKWGLIDSRGKFLVAAVYDNEEF